MLTSSHASDVMLSNVPAFDPSPTAQPRAIAEHYTDDVVPVTQAHIDRFIRDGGIPTSYKLRPVDGLHGRRRLATYTERRHQEYPTAFVVTSPSTPWEECE